MGKLEKRFPRYSRLLNLYPSGYRKKYKEQMLQTLADMLDDPEHSRSDIWLRTILDLPVSLVHQQLVYYGGAMSNMPDYVKRNGILGAWLVAPFFIFVTLNAITNQRLYRSLLWHSNILFTWLIVLPSLAILFNLAALLRWMNRRRKETGSSSWQMLTDFKNNWPALSVIIVALGILAIVFGHDSVQCITGNPLQELSHYRQTLHCIQDPPQGPR